ncbi:hypothetical protein TRVL_00467 [Trypanosoma vivax]|uniref:Uncharacterized protein n=1 Tax=Trypanosoma vivax (strain Y486) TaxID=1055687 RepID=G0U8M1_TRYVY|nr:hypothetical protein TRVL_00467 [Trypanosoma vivax]CCC53947.1 conserved hypothetical protein [Trypanosoma vivax Y486]
MPEGSPTTLLLGQIGRAMVALNQAPEEQDSEHSKTVQDTCRDEGQESDKTSDPQEKESASRLPPMGKGSGGEQGVSNRATSKKISWKCGMCGYHVLAMDHEGNPLPLSESSFGEVLPMSCPRCLLEHTDWQQSIPFDEYDNHANIRSRLSNNYVFTTNSENHKEKDFRPSHTVQAKCAGNKSVELPPILQEIDRKFRNTAKDTPAPSNPRPLAKPMAYYCGKCDRRLLRMDQYGELVSMVCDKDGVPFPITCPGCKEEHSEWNIKPLRML